MARLWIAIEGKKKAWNLPDRPVVVGSGEGAQIKLQGPGLAARHCRLEPGPGGWRAVLLAEADDLILNGRSVKTGDLRHGDVIAVAGQELHFEAEEAAVLQPVETPSSSSPRALAPPPRRAPSGSAHRGAGRSRDREEPEARPRGRGRGRAHQAQGLPGWAIVVLGLGVAVIGVFLVLQVLGGTLVDVEHLIQQAEQYAREGRLDDARKLVDQARAKASVKDQTRLDKLIDDLEAQAEKRRKEAMLKSEFEVLKKFEDAAPVRAQRKRYLVFELIYRIEEFRRENPNLPPEMEATFREWENRYAGVVDLRSEPEDLGDLIPLIRNPYGKTQHHKRFDVSIRRLADLRNRYRSPAVQAHLDLLEAEALKYANMFGAREVNDTEALMAKGYPHKDEITTLFPKLNEQLRDLRWMIDAVGLPEWQEKGKATLERFLAYREKLRQIRDGEAAR